MSTATTKTINTSTIDIFIVNFVNVQKKWFSGKE